MKKLLCALLAMLLLQGCASSSNNSSSTASETKGCSTLNVYNWGEYIGEDVIANFEDEYGVKVNYSLFDSNEIMYTKVKNGTNYDILVPSDYMIERLIEENLLQPLDHSKLTILDELDEGVLNKPYDIDNTYSIPYFWGTVGILYDTTKIDAAEVEEKGWDILKDESYKGDVFMYDSERDSFMVALKALGYSCNSTDENEIQEAYEWLSELHDNVDPAYVTDEVNDAMINSERALAVVYSGAAAYIMSENPDMAYYEPKEGTNIWNDALVIPATSKCSDLAHEFINFALSHESMIDSSLTVGYTSSIKSVTEELSAPGADFDGISAYKPRSSYELDEVFVDDPILKQKLSELWVKVKMR